jgi:hypothetical protein
MYRLVLQKVVRRHRGLGVLRGLIKFIDAKVAGNILLEGRFDCDP